MRSLHCTLIGCLLLSYVPAYAQATSLGDPVLHWNAIAIQAGADDHTGTFGTPEQMGPGRTARALAIVHAAIFDAVNSIDKSYKPYISSYPYDGSSPASIDAAVATAAHQTLVALYPKQKSVFDAVLQNHLSQISDASGKSLGLVIGNFVATRILQVRSTDHAEVPESYTPSSLPGKHRKDPMNPDQPYLGPQWGQVTPFMMTSTSQFRSPPPPDLTSQAYADAYNQVKLFGGNGTTTPTVRTSDQTQIGLFWAYDGVKKMGTPPRLYNQIARVIALQKGNTVVQNARLFALMNMAQADAGIGCWEAKYVYDYWRPVIAIREADAGTGPSGLGDNNPLTTGDPTWTPLGAPASNLSGNDFTPPFPAYPSGHATFGAAAFHTIALFYGTDEIPFTFTSDELNGVTTDWAGNIRPRITRTYTRLSEAIRENAQSRIYLGIHWQFDATAGIAMGNSIAEFGYKTVLTPVQNPPTSSSASSSGGSSNRVSIQIEDNPDPVMLPCQDTVTYEIKLQNSGQSSVRLDVRADLDSDMEFVDASDNGDEDGNDVLWEDIMVDADDDVTLTLEVRVDESLGDGDDVRLKVEAVIVDSSTKIADVSEKTSIKASKDGRCSVILGSTTVAGSLPYGDIGGGLLVDLRADQQEVLPGASVGFTLTLTNQSPNIMTGVLAEVTMNGGALFIEDSGGGIPRGVNGITWNIPALGPGETRTLYYRVNMGGGRVITSVAQVTAPGLLGPATDQENVFVIPGLPQTGIFSLGESVLRLTPVHAEKSGKGSNSSLLWMILALLGASGGGVFWTRRYGYRRD